MLKAVLKAAIKEDYWSFMNWYRDRFGLLPALFSYIILSKTGIGRAPNPLTGGYVYLRPGTTDQDVYDEIFLSKEYDIDLGNPLFIIDAGSHIGLSSVFFASKYPQATIIALEPEPSNFKVLLKNIENHQNIRAIRAGLWSRKTNLRIQDSSAETWSFKVIEDSSGNGIPAVTIQDIMADFDFKRIDFLKMDIEGSEVEVLNHSQAWVDDVSAMVIELHDRFKPGCSEALQKAFDNHSYDKSQAGEVVVMTNIKKIAA